MNIHEILASGDLRIHTPGIGDARLTVLNNDGEPVYAWGVFEVDPTVLPFPIPDEKSEKDEEVAMANLYGSGCAKCNKEIAAFLKEGPHMDGYLDTDAYVARYKHLPDQPWPLPHVDGEPVPKTVACVPGDDGWVLAQRFDGKGVRLCECGSDKIAHELWRGKVEFK